MSSVKLFLFLFVSFCNRSVMAGRARHSVRAGLGSGAYGGAHGVTRPTTPPSPRHYGLGHIRKKRQPLAIFEQAPQIQLPADAAFVFAGIGQDLPLRIN